MNKFEDKGKWWYCDCYGPNCMKLTIEKDPTIDTLRIDAKPNVEENKNLITIGWFYMDMGDLNWLK